MIKSIVIKVFRLTDITDRILKAKKSQKKMDDEHWQEKLVDEIHKIQLDHQLEIIELESKISMCNDTIKEYRNREKLLVNQEYENKKFAKENAYTANKISSKLEDFGLEIYKIIGEVKGIRDEADNNKLRIEKK